MGEVGVEAVGALGAADGAVAVALAAVVSARMPVGNLGVFFFRVNCVLGASSLMPLATGAALTAA